MYSLKPILVEQNIELPPCMYKLKPVNFESPGNMQESINKNVSENSEKIDDNNEKFSPFRESRKWSCSRRTKIESSRSLMS